MAKRLDLVLDCHDPETLAAFWTAALGYTPGGVVGTYTSLVPSDGVGPKLLLQQVPEPKVGKNRCHFDYQVDDLLEEAGRLVRLGAVRRSDVRRVEQDSEWIVMADPEGNEFCIWRPCG